MTDYVLIDGDEAQFRPNFGKAIVTVKPGTVKGSGPANILGKKICVAGDEGSVSVSNCTYMTPQHPIPGQGTLEIDALAGDQKAKSTNVDGKPVLLVGGQFTAKFKVSSPAKQPSQAGPVPDPTPSYSGKGQFMTNNTLFRGT